MMPVPLELPLRADEAAELAALLFEHAERKPLTGELRDRLAARAAALKLESITAYFGSLSRDPLHPSSYYLAVDGAGPAPLLLHLALATAPTSSVFHKPRLIGRIMNGPEFVVHAIPFGPGDREQIERFATRVDTAFLPRPQGARASLTVRGEYPRAFEICRALQKRSGRNLAAVAGEYHACVWAAIHAGWRQEYSVAAELAAGRGDEAGSGTLGYTRLAIDTSRLPRGEAALKAAAQQHEQIRAARALLKGGSGFELEVGLGGAGAEEAASSIEWLRQDGHAPDLVRVVPENVAALAGVARQHRVTLSFQYAGESGEAIESVVRATAGRFNNYAADPAEAEFLAEHLLS